MENKITEKKDNIVTVEVKVSVEEVNSEYKKAAQKIGKETNVSGFRKGKVPLNVLEKHVGEGRIIQDCIDEIIGVSYKNLVIELELDPIDVPKIDVKSMGKDVELVYTAEIPVVPEAKLLEYKNLKLERVAEKIKESEVKNELNQLRNKHSKLESISEEAKNGDTVVIDFEGFVDGAPFEGGNMEKHSLVLGSKTFIPGFEDAVLGVKSGDKLDVNVTFPKEYHSAELQGKEAVFKTIVHEVKRKVLPELDDEFAKDVSEFDTLKELKADVRKMLKEQKKKKQAQDLRMQALELGIDKIEVDVPGVMINRRIDDFILNIQNDLSQQGMDYKQYLELSGMSEETLRNEYRDNAEKQIKRDMLLDALSKEEGVKISDKDVEKEIESIALMYRRPVEEISKFYKEGQNLFFLKKGLAREKAMDLLVKYAEIIEVTEEEAEAKKAAKVNDAEKSTKKDAEKKSTAKKSVTKKAVEKKAAIKKD